MERHVLGALVQDRESYERLLPVISPDDFSEQGAILYAQINEFYENDPAADHADKDILSSRLQRVYPKHAERLTAALNSLEPCSAANVVQEYIELRVDRAKERCAQAMLSNDSGEISASIEEYTRWSEASDIEVEQDEEVLQGHGLGELVQQENDGGKIRLFPSVLNNAIGGGVPPESHILIYAPPEVGKSQLAITMACGFLTQGKKVLYIGNEDPARNMLYRFYSCITGMDKAELLRDIDAAQDVANRRGFSNLVFISQEGGTIQKLRKQIEDHKPDIVFVDQIMNFTSRGEEGVKALESISRGMRAVAKKYKCISVSVHQAAAEAQGKLYLDLGDVYFSNVAVQGAVDVMIGLGATADMLDTPRRMLNIPKNKLSGNHEPVEVTFNKAISRVS